MILKGSQNAPEQNTEHVQFTKQTPFDSRCTNGCCGATSQLSWCGFATATFAFIASLTILARGNTVMVCMSSPLVQNHFA